MDQLSVATKRRAIEGPPMQPDSKRINQAHINGLEEENACAKYLDELAEEIAARREFLVVNEVLYHQLRQGMDDLEVHLELEGGSLEMMEWAAEMAENLDLLKLDIDVQRDGMRESEKRFKAASKAF